MDAQLDESSIDNVNAREDMFVSQWQGSASQEVRERVDEILRPLGVQTRLLVIERTN